MKLNTKEYKLSKVKNKIKKTNFFCFFNGINLCANEWIIINQTIHKLNYRPYKIYNKIALKAIKTSTYKNYFSLINGLTIFLTPKSSETPKLNILSSIHPTLTLFSIKLNNRIYSINQIKNLHEFDYNQKIAFLYQMLKYQLKFPYKRFRNIKSK